MEIKDFFKTEHGISLLSELYEISDSIQKLRLSHDNLDIRISFYEYYETYLFAYINSLCALSQTEIEALLAKAKRINQSIKVESVDEHKRSICNTIYGQLIVSSWSNFEYCCSVIAEKMFTPDEKSKQINSKLNAVEKIIQSKSVELTLKEKDCLNKLLVSNSYHKIPNLPKILSLLKKRKNALGIERYNEFHRFVNLYSTLRNTMHSNFTYFGNEMHYEFDEVKFDFIPNHPVGIQPLNKSEIYFRLTQKLRIVFSDICKEFDNDLILDPSISM